MITGYFAYNIINDEEKRNVVTALIKEIEIYRNDESEYPLKRIGLNFPVFKDGGEVTELLWDKGNTVETVVLLSKGKIDSNMYQRSELDYLICNDAMGYADLVLNGNPETYLKTATEYKPLDS